MRSTYTEQCGVFLCRGCSYRRVAGEAIHWRKGCRCNVCGDELLWIRADALSVLEKQPHDGFPGAFLCAFCEEFIAGEAITERHWKPSEERFFCPDCKRPLSWIERRSAT